MLCVLTSTKLTTKKTELQVEPETLEAKVKVTKVQLLLLIHLPNLVLPPVPTKEIMLRVHPLKMPETFSALKLKLKLELPNQRNIEEMTVMMNQLLEAEVAEEEVEEVVMLAEMLEFKELMKMVTLTPITEETEEVQEVVPEVESTKDSIKKTEPEELTEVEEKEKTEVQMMPMLEVMSQCSNNKKSKKSKLSQRLNMKLSDNLLMISQKLEPLKVPKKTERLKE
jgi:hypothetical protein